MNDIIAKIKNTNNIVLLCHENPDGDAIGSTLAMYNALKTLGKDVDVVINDVPKRFSFINGFNYIKTKSNRKYNLGIVFDTAIKERINTPEVLYNVKEIIVIDHHQSNALYGDLNYVQSTSACCEIVYNIIKKMGVTIEENIAIPLCVGLITDTGGFANSNVTSETFLIASELIKIVDLPDIYNKVLNTITVVQLKLKKLYMNNLEFYDDGLIAMSYITEEDIIKLGGTQSDCDILVGIGREIENVKISIFIRVNSDGNRVSVRTSGYINADKILKPIGGGGHINAAGAKTNIEFNKLKEILIKESRDELNEWSTNSKQE